MALPLTESQSDVVTIKAIQGNLDITNDLTWVDLLKGMAIIGVFVGNGLAFFLSHGLIVATFYTPTLILRTAIGPFMQVFFILSGFVLTLGYLEHSKHDWSWKNWAWRRSAKIIFPYYVFVILSFLLGIIGTVLYENVNLQFSWTSFIAYLTLTRNFYPPSWVWNPPLWYMPVIIGLYAMFPFLLVVLRKWGPFKLLLISILITFSTLFIAAKIGAATGSHANDLFLFWTAQFTMGILLAYVRVNNPEKLRLLVGYRAILLGAVLFLCSWILVNFVPHGKIFNDSISSVGVFLILLNLGWVIRRTIPPVNRALIFISKQSYIMYLIHLPILYFIIGPNFRTPMHPITVFTLLGLYILAVFYLSTFLSNPIMKISSKLYAVSASKSAGARG
jgi:peptidoglycan/LPS O-acetylase OafA/YrhL